MSKTPLMLQAKQLEKLCIGVQLGGYEATRFKNQTPKPLLQSLDVLQKSAGADSAASEEAINRGLSLAKGNLLARWVLSISRLCRLAQKQSNKLRPFRRVLACQSPCKCYLASSVVLVCVR